MISVRVYTLNIMDCQTVKWDIETFLHSTGETWELKHVFRAHPTLLPMVRVRVDGFVGTRDDWDVFKGNLISYLAVDKTACVRFIRGKATHRMLSRKKSLQSVMC